MKRRKGFVSNSSSSSFLIQVAKDELERVISEGHIKEVEKLRSLFTYSTNIFKVPVVGCHVQCWDGEEISEVEPILGKFLDICDQEMIHITEDGYY